MKFNCKMCGSEFKCPPSGLGAGYCSKDCGNKARTRHGQSWSTEYVSWRDMKIRCLNPTKKDYPRYGGRGIKVCERWMTFDNFLADMGMKPSRKHTIDRINNDGNYEPSNCRWATRLVQSRNKSKCRRPGSKYLLPSPVDPPPIRKRKLIPRNPNYHARLSQNR